MRTKWIYIFLALLLPILFSLFLRYFGKSEFTIPVYYEQGISRDSLDIACHYTYAKPYLLPDSVYSNKGRVTLATQDSSAETRMNFKRLSSELEESVYNFVILKNSSADERFASCFLFLKKPWTTVLVDKEGRIRGYYAPTTREETDRLIVEMKILLKKY